MPVQPEFRFRDRWQTSLADAWSADRDDKGSDVFFRRLVAMLEQRDRELEDHLNTRLTLDVPGVRAIPAAAQSIANATNVTLNYAGTDPYDTDAFHDTATNNSRLTVPAGLAGLYHCGFSVTTNAAAGIASFWISINGGTYKYAFYHAINTSAVAASAADYVVLAAGDYIEAVGFQNSGAALIVNGTNSSFWMYRVGP